MGFRQKDLNLNAAYLLLYEFECLLPYELGQVT